MDRADFTLVTYPGMPELDPDDRLLADALTARGRRVRWAVWSDGSVDWDSAGTCVVRSTWDYDAHYPRFLSWIDRVGGTGRLLNPPEILRWNSHKTYLGDLERRGARTIPTVFVEPGRPRTLAAVLEERGWREVIVKPAVGLSTHGVLRVRADAGLEEGERHLEVLLARDVALVQPYLPAVATTGERAHVFIDGEFSHAVRKTPFQHLAAAGGAGECRVEPDPDEVAAARAALRVVQPAPIYARVDLVRGEDGHPLVMELELVEPSLYLRMGGPAAERLAEALCRRVG